MPGTSPGRPLFGPSRTRAAHPTGSMAYQSLYRKYRPQTFADVMGQGHVTRTLQNALASGRVAHGYLFTGTRGTAKTTVARLLAKALNCESQPRPVAEPCNACDACKSITAGTCIDVIEMDAASHRGVADVEEVRKSVGYGPMQFRYKVFIIDEAHQLSSDAKDAFLKTLEEPPDNVVFILATTEPQAIPITIRSRCQQFDFKRGSLAEITARLAYVLTSEGVTYEPAALNLVARGAEGSYRDSLSLLEQVLAFAPRHVTAADVDTVLGTLDAEMLSRVTDAVARRDAAGAFALAGQLLDAGKEARTLLRTLSLHFRDLLLVSVGGPAVASEMTADEAQSLQQEAQRFTPAQMMKAMEVLNEAQGETRWNNQHRLLVELTFLKLMQLGEGQGTGQTFPVAPIQYGVAGGEGAVARPHPPAPSPNSPALAPVGEGGTVAPAVPVAPVPEPTPAPAPVVVTPPVSQPVTPVSATPAVAEVEADEALPAGFFSDGATASEDEDDEADYSFGDDDAPPPADDEPEPPVIKAPVVAVSAPAEPAAAPVSPTEDDEDGDEAEPAEEIDNSPGLFEDDPELANAPVAAAPTPTPEPAAPAAAPAPEPPVVEPEPAPLPPVQPKVEPLPPAPVAPPPAAANGHAGSNGDGGSALFGDDPAVAVPPPAAPEAPVVSIDKVHASWPRFLQEAERISKRTAMIMKAAEPYEVNGKTVVLRMQSRANYEMITSKKEGQEFVRKLLALCLGLKSVGVRIELDPTQATFPKAGASPRTDQAARQRYDPLAALEEMVQRGPEALSARPAYPSLPPAPAPRPTAAPAGGDNGFGGDVGGAGSSFGFGSALGREAAPLSAPVPASSFATAPAAAPRPEAEYRPRPKDDPAAGWPAPVSHSGNDSATPDAYALREQALAEPLVQDVLSFFGGEVVID